MENNNPKISVITVVYNDKDGLEKTINSVLSQTYSSIEYIIIDGGSSDGTIDVIKKNEDKIGKWISEPDNGIYDAMNKGIRMATGEWLNFMNAGDIFIHPNVLSKIFSVEIPMGKSFIYSDVEKVLMGEQSKRLYHTDRERGFVHHQSSIYKRELHETYGYYLTSRPYSVYDMFFFMSIPAKLFYKTHETIAQISSGGVSDQGYWMLEKSEAAKVMFGVKSFNSAFCTVLTIKLRKKAKNIIKILQHRK